MRQAGKELFPSQLWARHSGPRSLLPGIGHGTCTSCGRNAYHSCRQILSINQLAMPRPAQIQAPKLHHSMLPLHTRPPTRPTHPCRSWKGCTAMREPQPRSRTTLAGGLPSAMRCWLMGWSRSTRRMASDRAFTTAAVWAASGEASKGATTCAGQRRRTGEAGLGYVGSGHKKERGGGRA